MESLRQYRNFSHDQNFAVPQSDHIDVRVLAASTKEDHTKPTGANYVVFSATDDFYVKMDGTAAVPAGDVTDGSGSELNPGVRYIADVTTISLIAPRSCTVTMAFYE
jgi:hypothetical protein